VTEEFDRAPGRRTVHAPNRYSVVLGSLRSAQKPAAKGAPAYSVYVNRKLGRYVAAAAHVAGLRPNGVTAISAVLTFSAIAVLAVFPPSLTTGLLVAGALALGYVFDSADGQVARLQGSGGPSGEWLDHVVDCIKTSSLHLAVLISMYRFFDLTSDLWLLIPLAFSVTAAVNFFAMILNDQLKAVYSGSRQSVYASTGGTLRRSLLLLPTDYGVLCLVFVLLAWPPAFLAVYGLLLLAGLGHTALALPKWFRDMRALDTSRAAVPEPEPVTTGA
jgi:phosphatidylglycerophosphate synthase